MNVKDSMVLKNSDDSVGVLMELLQCCGNVHYTELTMSTIRVLSLCFFRLC